MLRYWSGHCHSSLTFASLLIVLSTCRFEVRWRITGQLVALVNSSQIENSIVVALKLHDQICVFENKCLMPGVWCDMWQFFRMWMWTCQMKDHSLQLPISWLQLSVMQGWSIGIQNKLAYVLDVYIYQMCWIYNKYKWYNYIFRCVYSYGCFVNKTTVCIRWVDIFWCIYSNGCFVNSFTANLISYFHLSIATLIAVNC